MRSIRITLHKRGHVFIMLEFACACTVQLSVPAGVCATHTKKYILILHIIFVLCLKYTQLAHSSLIPQPSEDLAIRMCAPTHYIH